MRSKTLFLLTALLMLPLLVFLQGCGDVEGDLNANQSPTVEFVNVHNNSDSTVYDIAPMIYWKGNDPDGFIEFYSYADITESAAIENPVEYIDRIPDEAWVDTIATQARVYLLSQEGDTTEHVFFLRAEDNSGAQSDVIFRRFHRTNQAPRIPMIGLTGTDEGEYGTRYVVEDTLFTAPSVTNIYPGIQFSWRGSDPDDKALFTVPLEYQAVLVKSPAETVFVNPWTDQVDIQLIDLQTGFYTLNVWARDDGLTRSVAPARAEFYVIRPTFEHNMLVVLESPIPGFNPVVSPPTRDAVRAYYEDLLAQVAPQLQFVNLDLNDGVDVRFVTTEVAADKIPRSLIHQYKLTLFIADHALPQGNFDAQNYIPEKEQVMEDYLRVGGRVWQMGRMLYKSGLHYEASNEMQLTLQDFLALTV